MTYGYGYGDASIREMENSGEIKWDPPNDSKIVEFYKEKNILITGATGFLGKLLVEKLLRACPDLGKIYVLVRRKKGEDEDLRLEKMFDEPIYNPLKRLQPKFHHKLMVIKGDVSLPNLGLALSDRDLITEQVNIIYHIAATVRFDEKITTSIGINVRGTRDLLRIAKNCQNLESFVHVSTAYTNCNNKEIHESFYKYPVSAMELINMMEKLPEEAMVANTSKITKGWPNTYTFTKAIAEDAVKEFSGELPVCIVRPSIVVATYREPIRSWINNIYGVTGVVIGAGTGLMRTIHCREEATSEIVPADYVVNAMIASSYKTAVDFAKSKNTVAIYNYVSGVENRLTWKIFMNRSFLWGKEIPPVRSIWYNFILLDRYRIVHSINSLILHIFPAILMDLGLLITGHQPMMLKVYKKVMKFEKVIAHFATNQWNFHNDNTQALWTWLSDSDRKVFPFSMKELNWEDYHVTHVLGLRTYLLKDDLSTLPAARAKYNRFYTFHQMLKFLLVIILLKILYNVWKRVLETIV